MVKQNGSERVRLINFENVGSTNALLEHVGLEADLGALLSRHLLTVLRRQYADLTIESLEFLAAGNCTAGGVPTSNRAVINIDTLCIPIDANVVVITNKQKYLLNLHIRIIAERAGEKYDTKSDVIIKGQRFVSAL
jgi:hypothetical protein